MDALTKFLRNDTSAEKSYYVQTLKEKIEGHGNQRSFALRLVIHYVGDIHQPLHNSALVSESFPRGDGGGNGIPIENVKSGVKNLHSLYDSVLYEYTGYATLPLTDSYFGRLETAATSLSYRY